jgi:hypothetical protein
MISETWYKSNRKTRIRHGGKTSPNRTVIERCFGRLQDSAASPRQARSKLLLRQLSRGYRRLLDRI